MYYKCKSCGGCGYFYGQSSNVVSESEIDEEVSIMLDNHWDAYKDDDYSQESWPTLNEEERKDKYKSWYHSDAKDMVVANLSECELCKGTGYIDWITNVVKG